MSNWIVSETDEGYTLVPASRPEFPLAFFDKAEKTFQFLFPLDEEDGLAAKVLVYEHILGVKTDEPA